MGRLRKWHIVLGIIFTAIVAVYFSLNGDNQGQPPKASKAVLAGKTGSWNEKFARHVTHQTCRHTCFLCSTCRTGPEIVPNVTTLTHEG